MCGREEQGSATAEGAPRMQHPTTNVKKKTKDAPLDEREGVHGPGSVSNLVEESFQSTWKERGMRIVFRKSHRCSQPRLVAKQPCSSLVFQRMGINSHAWPSYRSK